MKVKTDQLTTNQKECLIKTLPWVDRVVIFEEDTPLNMIKNIKPDIIIKGGDYTVDKVVGNEFAEVKIFEFVEGFSTSKTIRKIK